MCSSWKGISGMFLCSHRGDRKVVVERRGPQGQGDAECASDEAGLAVTLNSAEMAWGRGVEEG